MANKVINIESKDKKSPFTKWTYADVSMDAEKGKFQKIIDEAIPFSLEYNQINESAGVGGKYKVGRNIDVNAVKRCVHNIFYWTPGERVLDPEFGNTIRKYLYDKINEFTVDQIVAELEHLIKKYEPRCIIDNLTQVEDELKTNTENNQISLVMLWHVDGLPEEKFQEELIF